MQCYGSQDHHRLMADTMRSLELLDWGVEKVRTLNHSILILDWLYICRWV